MKKITILTALVLLTTATLTPIATADENATDTGEPDHEIIHQIAPHVHISDWKDGDGETILTITATREADVEITREVGGGELQRNTYNVESGHNEIRIDGNHDNLAIFVGNTGQQIQSPTSPFWDRPSQWWDNAFTWTGTTLGLIAAILYTYRKLKFHANYSLHSVLGSRVYYAQDDDSNEGGNHE